MIQEFHFWVFIPQKTKNTNLKRYLHPHIHCSIIYNSQDMETTKEFIDGWMDKENVYTHTNNGILFSHKKEGNPAICENMNGPQGHYATWNTNPAWSHLYVESEKTKTKLIEKEIRFVVTGVGGREKGNWMKGIKRYKPPIIK